MVHSTAPSPVVPPGGGRAWATSAALSLAVGLVAAAIELGTPGLPYLLVVLSGLGWLMASTLQTAQRGIRSRWRWGLLSGLAGTAAIGLLTAFGVVGLVWIGGLAVSHRRVWRLMRGWWSTSSPRNPDSRPPDDLISCATSDFSPGHGAAGDLSDVSVEGLCLAWRRSYVALDRARSAVFILALAEHRRLILEEIDRRDAQGLGRWLESNPRAAGNPLPYLSHPGTSDRVNQDGTDEQPS